MAVPRRLPVLGAKVLIYATVIFVLMLVATAISFFGTQGDRYRAPHPARDRLSGCPPGGRPATSSSSPSWASCAALASAGGVRNSAGGIAAFVGLIFVLSGIVDILPTNIADAIMPYLPLNAGTAPATYIFDNSHHLTPWGGFGLFCGYTLIVLLGASWTLVRRDA